MAGSTKDSLLGAIAAGQLKKIADDRQAVTAMVSRLSEASDVEVKDLARETADATQKVSEQIRAIQSNSGAVSAGIHATSEIISRMDAVQTRITEVLERQAAMARAFSEQ